MKFHGLWSVLAASLFAAPAVAQDTIKIGVTQPLTGAFAASGNYVADGAKIAEAAVNASGGVFQRRALGKPKDPMRWTQGGFRRRWRPGAPDDLQQGT